MGIRNKYPWLDSCVIKRQREIRLTTTLSGSCLYDRPNCASTLFRLLKAFLLCYAITTHHSPYAIARTGFEFADEQLSHKKRLVELTQSTMMDVRAALREFYLINTSWPVSLGLIQSANGYYVGDLITPYGMIEGDVTINAYEVYIELPTLDAQEFALLKTALIASGGQIIGTRALYLVRPPLPLE